MKVPTLTLFRRNAAALIAFGFLSIFGMANTAHAGCITGQSANGEDPSVFALAIDANSSCTNLTGTNNNYGCEIDNSGTSCTIYKNNDPNSSEFITVNLTQGTVGGTTPVNWEISGSSTSLVDFVIVGGASNGSSTCGYSYAPGSEFGAGLIFEKSNSDFQKITSISFCSNFVEPAQAEPRLVVTKTVKKIVDGDENCSGSVESIDIAVDESVRYCYKVENVGAGDATLVTLSDDNGVPGGEPTLIPLVGLEAGRLNSGGVATGQYEVQFIEAGTVVNTATASGFDKEGNPDEDGNPYTGSDIATVNAVKVAEACPENYQEAVNQLSATTGLDFAFLLDPNESDRRSVCVPDGGTDGNLAKTKRYACIDECITKPECVGPAPLPASCSPSVCEPSGSWTTKRTGTDPGTFACEAFPEQPYTPENDPLPYCWEVQQDLKGDCSGTVWIPQDDSVLHIKKGRVNPYVWQTCYSAGGRYVCETMCYLFPGDTSDACPLGSTVF